MISNYLIIVSCDLTQKRSDPKEESMKQNDETFDNTKEEYHVRFLVHATEYLVLEIELGRLAQQRGKLADVTDLGKLMEIDHTKNLAELRNLANQKLVTLPLSPTNKAQDALKKLYV